MIRPGGGGDSYFIHQGEMMGLHKNMVNSTKTVMGVRVVSKVVLVEFPPNINYAKGL